MMSSQTGTKKSIDGGIPLQSTDHESASDIARVPLRASRNSPLPDMVFREGWVLEVIGMRLGSTLLLLVVIPAGPVVGFVRCVTNGTDAALHFTVEDAATGLRRAADLAHGQSLCLRSAAGGTVAMFESARGIEGCSRLVPAGQNDTLLAFARFDRCRWASHAPDSMPHD